MFVFKRQIHNQEVAKRMEIFSTISETQKYLKEVQRAGKTIGFVPTMGALHEGHLELVRKAKAHNDVAVCSIFVNPTQFNNPEDLKKYPRTLEADCELLLSAGCDLVFAPTADEMYPQLPVMKFNFGNLETVMEGKFRPGHFNGVGIVVSKLFNIVKPDKAYFGLKDLQQVAVINRMVIDLSFDLELIPCPTVREADGLAMSSRNRRLSEKGRELAPKVYESLCLAKKELSEGKSSEEVKVTIQDFFKHYPAFELEYIEISDFESLEPIKEKGTEGKTAICMAIFLEGVRLIDNIVF